MCDKIVIKGKGVFFFLKHSVELHTSVLFLVDQNSFNSHKDDTTRSLDIM